MSTFILSLAGALIDDHTAIQRPTKYGLCGDQKDSSALSVTVEPPHNPAPALFWRHLN